MPAGRPLKFKSVEELQSKIDEYFVVCKENHDPYTVSGLAYFLDTTRDVLIDYENMDSRRPYSNAIKRAKQRIQAFAENRLYSNQQVAGVIFALKNNYGWRDKQEIEHTGDITITLDGDLDKWSK